MKRKKKKIEVKLCDIIENEIKENSLRQYFPKSIQVEIDKLKKIKLLNHKDFTKIPFVTIDGKDSKDFDDAVWSETQEGITKIMVAISDVSFYVKKNDPIDIEAKKRGNSFYFPDRVIPMLPKEISNDICSLIPNEERACVIVEINIKNFKVMSFNIHRAKIISIARLTYSKVDEIHKSNLKNDRLFSLIKNLFNSYKVLKKISENREKINFSTSEFEIIDQSDKDFYLKKKKRLQSYGLIEEFMILANENVARFLKRNKLNTIFRNHEKPKNEKIKELKNVLTQNNIYNNESFNYQKDFNKILKIIKENNFFLNESLLRTQSKAYYSEKNIGHFGLGLDFYTHFTSPIRRYSDLHVHRDLMNFFFDGKKNKQEPNLYEHLTLQEKKSDHMERKILERACSLYLKNQKQKHFVGVIDGIEKFGIFIRAIDLPFSCLVRNKYRGFNDNKFLEKKFRIGQVVTFKIKKNDVMSGKILADNVKIISGKI